MATIDANTGSCIASMPRISRSDGVLTLCGDAPAGSAKWVCVIFIVAAREFIFAMKASSEPASHLPAIPA